MCILDNKTFTCILPSVWHVTYTRPNNQDSCHRLSQNWGVAKQHVTLRKWKPTLIMGLRTGVWQMCISYDYIDLCLKHMLTISTHIKMTRWMKLLTSSSQIWFQWRTSSGPGWEGHWQGQRVWLFLSKVINTTQFECFSKEICSYLKLFPLILPTEQKCNFTEFLFD